MPTVFDDDLRQDQTAANPGPSGAVDRPGCGIDPTQLLSALPAAIYLTDAAGRITFYNAAAAQLWGYAPELGSQAFSGSHRLYWADGTPMRHDECPMAVALKTGKPLRGMEAVTERPDGTRVPFMAYPTPIRDRAGNLVGAINMLVDVTEQKAFEQALRSQAQFAAIVETSCDAIACKDLDGILTSWNQAAARIFGYTAEEMIGSSTRTLIPPERQQEEDEILERVRRGERVEHYETVRVRKDGVLVDISLSVSPIKDARGKVIGASKIARDITERKQAQARQELLAREINHRTKNLFAVVNAVVWRSFAGKTTVEEARDAVLARLHSLAQTHVMLLDKSWHGADLGELVRSELGPYMGRVSVEGPPIELNPQPAQNFALALHELATNAAKYGALSRRGGKVRITWSVSPDGRGSRRFQFRWSESGGPPVVEPKQRGFGSVVLEQVMAEYFDDPPLIEFAQDGIAYELRGSLDAIASTA
ncbi:MAG TPA: PAS domain S-box protein [Hyphomicrobiaceae bacterium]|nr:PAS domain S-box protein [Hyphomicrobiaceae bacterium]